MTTQLDLGAPQLITTPTALRHTASEQSRGAATCLPFPAAFAAGGGGGKLAGSFMLIVQATPYELIAAVRQESSSGSGLPVATSHNPEVCMHASDSSKLVKKSVWALRSSKAGFEGRTEPIMCAAKHERKKSPAVMVRRNCNELPSGATCSQEPK